MKKSIFFLRKISLFKTLYFNLHYLSIKEALKFPILVSHNFLIKKAGGKIIMPENIKFGQIKLGFNDVGIFDRKRSKGIWQVEGIVNFKGDTILGQGTKISINKNAHLELGHNFVITAESQIISENNITFGNDCLISWESLIMDTDFHKIYNEEDKIINEPKKITIGDKVWIGCRCTILKGAIIPNNSIIGSNTVITNKLTTENSIYVGNNAKKIKENIYWNA